jgi:hypothetical protein
LFGIDKLAGLPLHVLIVHFAVVLVPLAAIGLIATGWKAEWRKKYALAIAVLAVVGAGAALVAAQSGESLQHSITQSAAASGLAGRGGESEFLGDHPEQGNTAEVLAIIFAGASCVAFAVEQWGDRLQVMGAQFIRWQSLWVYVVSSGIGIFALVTMIIAGHSGATLVWKDLGNFVSSK